MPSRSRSWQSFCLALVSLVAPAAAIGFLLTIIVSLVQELRFPREKRDGVSIYTYEEQVFDHTGEPLIRVRSGGGQWFLDSKRNRLKTASRDVLPIADLTRPNTRIRLDSRNPLEVNGILPVTYPESLDIDWFLVLTDRPSGRAQFEGFHAVTAQRVGWIGTNGFVDAPPPESAQFVVDPETFLRRSDRVLLSAEQIDWKALNFEYPTRARRRTTGQSPLVKHQFVLLAREQLFLIDMARRTVEEMLPGQPVRAIDSTIRPRIVATNRAEAEGAQEEILELTPYVTVRTADRIILLSPAAKVREEYLLPADLQERDLRIGLPVDGSLVVQSFETRLARETRPPDQFFVDTTVLAADGKEIQSEKVMLVNHHVVEIGDTTQLALASLIVPAPAGSMLMPAAIISADRDLPFAAALSVAFSKIWPMQLVIALLALGLVWWTDRRQRALGLGRSVPWLVFVFLFGLPGFLAYLVHRRWPIQNLAPLPKRLGIEVFG